jgi:hypothetical protein
MMEALKALFKQPYWVIALVAGAVLVASPCVTVEKDRPWSTHSPNTLLLPGVGIALLLVSAAAFIFVLVSRREVSGNGVGVDLTQVNEKDGVLWTVVGGCEVRVVSGHLEDYAREPGAAIVLPCNEYFDDLCAADTRSALGAYVSRVFDGQATAFVSLVKDECKKRFGPGVVQQKTSDERAESFGVGRCISITSPLGHSTPVALVSTTTQRAGEGLSARISYLFDGMRELSACLADARLTDIVMPVLGAGHGGIDPPLAFVGLLLAVAEAARYRRGSQRLKRVTVVVFKRNADSPSEVHQAVIRRALALIGAQDS